MPGSKKPRKSYRKRAVNAVAHLLAMNSVTVLTEDEREQCCSAVEHALDCFETGNEPAFQWAVMADALNVAEALSDLGICSDEESKSTILQGQQTLASLYGNWSPTPGDSYDLTRAIQMHRIQLSLCDYSEYCRAIELVTRKINGVMAGNVPTGAVVYESTIRP